MLNGKEKMLASDLCAASDPILVQEQTRTRQLLHHTDVTKYPLTGATRRPEILR